MNGYRDGMVAPALVIGAALLVLPPTRRRIWRVIERGLLALVNVREIKLDEVAGG